MNEKMQTLAAAGIGLQLCNCMGPRPGEPRCPCAMRNVVMRNGRWVQLELDLGPVSDVALQRDILGHA